MGLILGLGRSPGEGNGNPLQYSCLGNPLDKGAWWATVHGVATSQAFLLSFIKIFFGTTRKGAIFFFFWLILRVPSII